MKILHICSDFSIDFQGGITNYVRSLATEQVREQNEVWVMDYSQGVHMHPNGFTTVGFKSKNDSWSNEKKVDPSLEEEIKIFLDAQNFDLIHFHMWMNFGPNVIQLFQKYKYVVSLHDYFSICPRIIMMRNGKSCDKADERCLNCFSVVEKNLFLGKVYKKIWPSKLKEHKLFPSKKIILERRSIYYPFLSNAKALFPVSNRVKEIFENSGVKGNYTVLHIGNETAKTFNYDYVYKPNSKTINLVLLSNASYQKGGPLLCSILQRVTNPLIVPHFYGRCSGKTEKMLRDSGFVIHGPYKQKQLSEILENMDIGAVLSIWEDNGPQVVMEMLNNRVPVLGTKMGGIPDFISNDTGFLFNPYSLEEIEEAVKFLNGLTKDKIKDMKMAIKPTLTPEEHAKTMNEKYKIALI